MTDVSEKATLTAGLRIDERYRLESPLEGFGRGEVWTITDTSQRDAALCIKLLPATTPEKIEQFKTFAESLEDLQHPNVVPVVATGVYQKRPYIVHEKFEGRTLRSWLRQQQQAPVAPEIELVWKIWDQICMGVRAAHRTQLCHNSIAPECVLVDARTDDTFEVGVLDFGIRTHGVEISEVDYWAPEQNGEEKPTAAQDVFALTVVLTEMLVPDVHERPELRQGFRGIVRAREASLLPVLQKLRADAHKSVWEAIAQGLRARPEQRPNDASKLRDVLRKATWVAVQPRGSVYPPAASEPERQAVPSVRRPGAEEPGKTAAGSSTDPAATTVVKPPRPRAKVKDASESDDFAVIGGVAIRSAASASKVITTSEIDAGTAANNREKPSSPAPAVGNKEAKPAEATANTTTASAPVVPKPAAAPTPIGAANRPVDPQVAHPESSLILDATMLELDALAADVEQTRAIINAHGYDLKTHVLEPDEKKQDTPVDGLSAHQDDLHGKTEAPPAPNLEEYYASAHQAGNTVVGLDAQGSVLLGVTAFANDDLNPYDAHRQQTVLFDAISEGSLLQSVPTFSDQELSDSSFADPSDEQAVFTELARYEGMLDRNPRDLGPLEKIEDLLTAAWKFDELANAYQRMLHRLVRVGERELQFILWHRLGMLNMDHLGRLDTAIQAFEMAARIKPEDIAERRTLAELHTQIGDPESAATHWRAVLAASPRHPEALHALYDLYQQSTAYDKAFCVAATATFLLRDDVREDIQMFYLEHSSGHYAVPSGLLEQVHWAEGLVHPDVEPSISEIFAAILPSLRAGRVRPIQELGLEQGESHDPGRSPIAAVRALARATDVLNLPVKPAIFLRRAQPIGLAYLPSEPWATGVNVEKLTNLTEQQVRFAAARHMTYYRNEYYARVLFPSADQLAPYLYTAVRLVAPGASVGKFTGDLADLKSFRERLSRSAEQTHGLRTAVRAALSTGTTFDLDRWFRAIELTACRVGLLLAGDLHAVRRSLKHEQWLHDDAPPAEKLRELVLFSVSDTYFYLRQMLGLAISS